MSGGSAAGTFSRDEYAVGPEIANEKCLGESWRGRRHEGPFHFTAVYLALALSFEYLNADVLYKLIHQSKCANFAADVINKLLDVVCLHYVNIL